MKNGGKGMNRKAGLYMFLLAAFGAWMARPFSALGAEPNRVAETGGASGAIYGIVLMAAAGVVLIALAVISICKRKK